MIFIIKRVIIYIKLIWYHIVFYCVPTLPVFEGSYYTNIGTIYFELEKYKKAILSFKKSEKCPSNNDRNFTRYNFYYIGYSYLNLGNHKKSAEYFELYLKIVPNDTDIIGFVGWCYLLQNKREAALISYTRLAELNPDLPLYRIESAKILFELKKKDEAFTQLRIAEECSKDVALQKLIASMKHRFDGDLKNSLNKLKQAINIIQNTKGDLYPQLDDLYILLSELYKENGNQAEAISILEDLYKMNPHDLWNINCLAFEYADQKIKLKKALGLIERCLAFQPENSYFLDTKSWVLFRMNNIDQSKKIIRISLKLNPHANDAKEHYKVIMEATREQH